MKIAHVVDCLEVGGLETIVQQMSRLQREQGHFPCVYAIATLGPLGEQMLREGFEVSANVGRHLADSARSFFRIFRRVRPDVVHLHNQTPTIYAAAAARMAGVPSIVSTRHSLAGPPYRAITELKHAAALTCCDWLVGICDATSGNLKKLRTAPARKIVRVYNGALPIQRVPKEDWPAKSGFTFLYVGRLAPVKNHWLLLKAFSVALSIMPRLRLWLVGDGTERSSLENLARELNIATQITFWGQQLEVARFFSAADAFIMSSKSEGLPVSLLQAFSAALPSIVTDAGGMAEVVRLANAGLIASPADPADLARAMLRLASSRADQDYFAANAEKAFYSNFTLEKMTSAYLDLYRSTHRARSRSQD